MRRTDFSIIGSLSAATRLAGGGLGATPQRTRLTPGVPAGGVAALAVTVLFVGWSMLAGPEEGAGDDHKVVIFRSDAMPRLPLPPLPPQAPVAPRLPPAPGMADSGIGSPIDGRPIAAQVKAMIKESEDRAVALAKAMEDQDSDVDVVERYENNRGENQVSAQAVAPAGLRLADVNGSVAIKVDPAASAISFTMVNSRKRYNLSVNDGVLWISGPGPKSHPATDFTITVPTGTPLLVNDFVGSLTLDGDLKAPIRVELQRGEMDVRGSVSSARVRITESGKVELRKVDDLLAVQINGKGTVTADNADRVAGDLGGAGTLRVDTISSELVANLPGQSKLQIGTLNGLFRVNVPGYATVGIGDGQVRNFELAMRGAGDIRFGGIASSPRIDLSGAGNVSIARHDGVPSIRRTGIGRVALGN
jgi:hypothetical protein